MSSYNGPLNQQILVKLDPSTKQALAEEAERQQSSLSFLARLAIRAYLAGLNQGSVMEESHGT